MFLNQVGTDLDVYPSSGDIYVCYPVAAIIEDFRYPVRAAQQRRLIDEMLTRMAETRDQEDRDGQKDMGDDDDDDDLVDFGLVDKSSEEEGGGRRRKRKKEIVHAANGSICFLYGVWAGPICFLFVYGLVA
ncbi:unnamed protein product [Linum trigynum]|uniref:Uncharacterized protein n=1 Tax=Linum trigynum TaxID=586398 RepID=A0AAV2E0L0_9ROSI